jgi:heptaprenyl diphosphate synthase
MTPLPAAGTPSPPLKWRRPPGVDASLREVERRLLTAAATGEGRTSDVCGHLVRAGGKRLRPSLLLLAAEFGGGAPAAVLDAAVGIELLHVATLYHDDVCDEATHRRGRASANRLWGNRAAVFAGSYLFSRAIEHLARGGEYAGRLASAALAEVWKGQAQETENVRNLDLEEATYFEIVRCKTAALCELPCRLGALLGGVEPSLHEALARYGDKLGCAFQVTDDILDVAGDGARLGKPPGIDLVEGVYTLPVLYALRAEPDRRLRALLARPRLDPPQLGWALARIRASGAVERATDVARTLAAEAADELRVLPPGPVVECLRGLAREVAGRTGEGERAAAGAGAGS